MQNIVVNENVNNWNKFVVANFSVQGFLVLTVVVMKSAIFWDTTPYSSFSVNRLFGGIYRLHLQGPKINLSKKPAWKQAESTERTTRRYIPEDGTLLGSSLNIYHCIQSSLLWSTREKAGIFYLAAATVSRAAMRSNINRFLWAFAGQIFE
jgi:hypothetical protein